MSAWRQVAFEKSPQHRELVERSDNIGLLWVDLWLVFVDAHREPIDEGTIRGIYEFASWTCEVSDHDELATSTTCHFYEHLPLDPLVRAKMRQYLPRRMILELTEIFGYHLTDAEHRELMRELLSVE